MPFDNDDLKRFKEIIETDIREYPIEVSPYIRLDVAHSMRDSIPALLARLEAAEACIIPEELIGSLEEKYEAWRKASGKTSEHEAGK